MKTLRIAQAALATILALGISSNTYAFMVTEVEAPADVQVNLTEMVSSLQQEIDAGETSCEDMLAKLDAALKVIDDKLDEGVANEDEYLEARKAISKMRYGLDCLANKLTLDGGMPMDLGMPAPMAAPLSTVASPVSSSGCSTCSSGSCGGGGAAGHGGEAIVGLAGIGAIIALPFAFDDNNGGPGIIASPSN